eukprot:637692-Pleurochrysis_carterae.AAC.2
MCESHQVIDVNGIRANVTLVCAVGAVSENFVDDQGEQTDPATDFAVMANTAKPNDDGAAVDQEGAASPWAGGQARGSGAASLFETPSAVSAELGTATSRARSNVEIEPMANVEAARRPTTARRTQPSRNHGTSSSAGPSKEFDSTITNEKSARMWRGAQIAVHTARGSD